AALCGWALVEPEPAEPAPPVLFLAALPFALVFMRALWRALRSATTSYNCTAIATVGLLRPRIVVSPHLAEVLDASAMAAALAHEAAHVRYRDPLRLWLAQFGTDLLWPWPMAESRLRAWRQALELARDEEARLGGVTGPDLAAAIL